jgi:hypothetical protein
MGMPEKYFVKLAVAAAFMAGGINIAQAADDSNWDRFRITAGTFKPSIDSTVRLDTSALLSGTELDLEDDLALEDSENLFSIEVIWRLTKRFSLEGGYFELGRSGSTLLAQTIDFGNQTFIVAADVATTMNTDIASLAMQYSFWHSEKLDIAASLGAYLIKIEANLDSTTPLAVTESFHADAPLPLLGLRAEYYFTPRLSMNLKARYFAVEISDVDGSMSNFMAGLQYNLFENIGLGIGYEYFDVDVTSQNADFPGILRFQYDGPKLFMTAQF